MKMRRSNKKRKPSNPKESSYPKTTCKLVYINFLNVYTKLQYTSETEKNTTKTNEEKTNEPFTKRFWRLYILTLGFIILYCIINSQMHVSQYLRTAYFSVVLALSAPIYYYGSKAFASAKINLIATAVILVCLSVSLGTADPGSILQEYRQKISDQLFPAPAHK